MSRVENLIKRLEELEADMNGSQRELVSEAIEEIGSLESQIDGMANDYQDEAEYAEGLEQELIKADRKATKYYNKVHLYQSILGLISVLFTITLWIVFAFK